MSTLRPECPIPIVKHMTQRDRVNNMTKWSSNYSPKAPCEWAYMPKTPLNQHLEWTNPDVMPNTKSWPKPHWNSLKRSPNSIVGLKCRQSIAPASSMTETEGEWLVRKLSRPQCPRRRKTRSTLQHYSGLHLHCHKATAPAATKTNLN